MEDMSSNTVPHQAQQDASNQQATDVAATVPPGADDGSNFYNTPLDSPKPAVAPESETKPEEHNEKAAPAQSTVDIPGLSMAHGEQPAPDAHESKDTPANADSAASTKATDDTPMTGMGKDHVEHSEASGQQGEASAAQSTSPLDDNNDTQMGEQPDAEKNAQTANDEQNSEGRPVGGPPEEEGEEHPEWEIDSSPYESSSSDSSDESDDDDDDEEDEQYTMLDPAEAARMLMAAEGGSDDESGPKGDGSAEVRTANEKPEEVVPVPDITVTPDMRVEMLGNVETIVDNVILIKGNISGEYQVLESGSVLCLDNLNVIGCVADTLGRVEQPLYTVRFPSAAAIKEHGIEVGKPIFYLYEHSTFVFTQPLKGLKGSDASNIHDEEVGEDEAEFSDDEAEAAYRRAKKQAKKGKKPERARPAPGRSALRNTETLNYDDEPTQEDGYTPLARPPNFHEITNPHDAPVEGSHRPPYPSRGTRTASRGRGRGRGGARGGRDDRGRGHWQESQQPDYSRSPSAFQNQAQQPAVNPATAFQSPLQNTATPPLNFFATATQQQQQQPQQPSGSAPFNAPLPTMPLQPYATQPLFPQLPQMPQMPQVPQMPRFPFPPPPGSHINPAFFPALSPQLQQQLQQLQQFQHQQQQTPQQGGFGQANQQPQQTGADAFAAAQAQLDILKRLSGNGGQQ